MGEAAPETIPALPLENSANDPPAKVYRKAVFPIDGGDVTVIFPERISKVGCADLEAYLKVLVERLKRDADMCDGNADFAN